MNCIYIYIHMYLPEIIFPEFHRVYSNTNSFFSHNSSINQLYQLFKSHLYHRSAHSSAISTLEILIESPRCFWTKSTNICRKAMVKPKDMINFHGGKSMVDLSSGNLIFSQLNYIISHSSAVSIFLRVSYST